MNPSGSPQRTDDDAFATLTESAYEAATSGRGGEDEREFVLNVERQAAEQKLAEFYGALFARTPRTFVTQLLIAANVAVYLWMLAAGVHWMRPAVAKLVDWGANFGPLTAGGEPWRLLTSAFVHIGLIHLAVNMYALWAVGGFVERLLGNAGFAATYALSGLIGSLASAYWNPGVVSAGASGAVFGVCGACLGFILPRRDSLPAEMLRSVRNQLLTVIVLNVAIGATIPQIDLAAHVGGLACGFLCGWALSRRIGPEAPPTTPWLRLGALAVVGAAAVWTATALLPNVQPQLAEWRTDSVNREHELIDEINDLFERSRNGELDDGQFAATLKGRVIPQWNAIRREYERQVGAPEAADRRRIEYLRLRERSLVLLVEAIEQKDQRKADEAAELAKRAGAIARESNH